MFLIKLKSNSNLLSNGQQLKINYFEIFKIRLLASESGADTGNRSHV